MLFKHLWQAWRALFISTGRSVEGWRVGVTQRGARGGDLRGRWVWCPLPSLAQTLCLPSSPESSTANFPLYWPRASRTSPTLPLQQTKALPPSPPAPPLNSQFLLPSQANLFKRTLHPPYLLCSPSSPCVLKSITKYCKYIWKLLEQHPLKELSAIMEMFSVCIVQYRNHSLSVAILITWSVASVTEESNF